jgi:hypothetical protein
MFYWLYEYETYLYYDGPLSMSWTDSQGVCWYAHSNTDKTHIVKSCTPEGLQSFLDGDCTIEEFMKTSLSGVVYEISHTLPTSVESHEAGSEYYMTEMTPYNILEPEEFYDA